MGKWLARQIIHLIIRLTTRLEVQGLENIQGVQNGIAVGNHIGRLDALLVYHFTQREDIIMLVAEKYQRVPLVRWFARQLDWIFIDRYNADFTVLREVLKRLRKGGILTISPEGTRSPNAQLQPAWLGTSYLAVKSGSLLIPVGLAGSQDGEYLANMRRFRRTLVRIRVGAPFILPHLPNMDREAELQRHTDEIMCRIAALLPPSYRGVYADHPRLKELLGSS